MALTPEEQAEYLRLKEETSQLESVLRQELEQELPPGLAAEDVQIPEPETVLSNEAPDSIEPVQELDPQVEMPSIQSDAQITLQESEGEDPSFLSQLTSFVKDPTAWGRSLLSGTRDAADALIKLPIDIYGGLTRAEAKAFEFIESFLPEGLYEKSPSEIATEIADNVDKISRNDILPELPDQLQPKTSVEEMAANISQFFIPLVGTWGKFYKLAKSSSVLSKINPKAASAISLATEGAGIQAVFFDSLDNDFSELLEYFPEARGTVIEWMADTSNDPGLEGRMKGIIANSILNLALGGLGHAGMAGISKGKQLVQHPPEIQELKKQAVDKIYNVFKSIKDIKLIRQSKGDEAAFKQAMEQFQPVQEVLDMLSKQGEVIVDESGEVTLKGGASVSVNVEDIKPVDLDPQQKQLTESFAQQLNKNISSGINQEIDLSPLLNSNTFESPENIQFVVQSLMESARLRIDKKKIPFSQTVEEAEKRFTAMVSEIADLGFEPKGLAYVLQQNAEDIWEAEVNAVVAKNVISTLSNQAIEISNIAVKDLDPQALQKLNNIRIALRTLLDPYAKVRYRFGHGLGSFKQTDTFTSDIREILESPESGLSSGKSSGGLPEPKTLEDAVLKEITNPNLDGIDLAKAIVLARNKFAKQKVLTTLTDFSIKYFINSILSHPLTQGINILGTAFKSVLLPVEELLGSAVIRDKKQFNTALSTLLGYRQFLLDSLYMSAKSFWVGEPIVTNTSMVESMLRRDGRLASLIPNTDNLILQGLKFLLGTTDTVVGFPGRLMMTSDEFFKEMVYRSRLKALITQDGLDSGLKGKELNEFIENQFKNSFDEFGFGLDPRARRYAEEATFTLKPDQLSSQFIGELTKLVQSGTKSKHGVIRFISRLTFPFVVTPANILQDIINHTPGARLLAPKIRASIRGEYGPEEQSKAIGQLMAGAMIWSLGILAASEGRITGSGPKNPEARKLLTDEGWQPFSFVIDNEDGTKIYIPLSRLDPWGSVLGLAASAVEIMESVAEEEWDDLTRKSIIGLTNNLTSKRYLTGMNNILHLLTGAMYGDPLKKEIEAITSAYIPNVLSVFKDDPYLRDAQTLIDTWKKKLPGYSKEVPVERDIVGRPVLGRVFGLWTIRPNDPLTQEIVRLAEKGGSISKIPDRYGSVDFKDYKNKTGQTAADRLGELMETQPVLNGKTLSEFLTEYIQSPGYNQLTDPFGTPDDENPGGKVFQLRKIISKHRLFLMKKYLFREDFFNSDGTRLGDAVIQDKETNKMFVQQQELDNETDQEEQTTEELIEGFN